jgi:hypothetical protein
MRLEGVSGEEDKGGEKTKLVVMAAVAATVVAVVASMVVATATTMVVATVANE